MIFQNLNINSNNSFYEKCLDLLFQNESQNNEANNFESSVYNRKPKNIVDLNFGSYDTKNLLELYSKNNNNPMDYTRESPRKDNISQLISNSNDTKKLIDISNNLFLKKKKNGRKGLKPGNIRPIHTKFAADNLQMKCKNLIMSYTLDYVNEQIKNIYEGNIGNGIHIKKLLDINQVQKSNKNNFNSIAKFKSKTIKEIFSTIISTKYTSFLPNHNEIIINRALTEKDEEKRKKFIKLFNLTFSECIQKFLGIDKSKDCEGFPVFDDIKHQLNESNEYLKKIKEYLVKYGTKEKK